MVTARVIGVIREFAREPDSRSDGELVTGFSSHREEAAFEELLRRHGPMVYGVCRRVLRQTHDANDAFQAVFLILTRKANTVQPPGAVGHWLYGVAVKTAVKARSLATLRKHRLMAVAKPEAVTVDAEHSDIGPMIDEELAKLPEKYRTAFVLCDVAEKSRSEAARELGWPEGTLASRLAKARSMLANKLRQRGVTLPATTIATLFTADAAFAAIPSPLVTQTLSTVLSHATETTPLISPTVHNLAESVMHTKTMLAGKLTMILLLATALTAGVMAWPNGDNPEAKKPNDNAKPVPSAPGQITWKQRDPAVLDGWLAGSVTYSPTSKKILVGRTSIGSNRGGLSWLEVWPAIPTFRENGGLATGGSGVSSVAYSSDGKLIALADGKGITLCPDPSANQRSLKTDAPPLKVAFFPDKSFKVGDETFIQKKLIYQDARGVTVKTWIDVDKIETLPEERLGTIRLSLVLDGQPTPTDYALPLAVDPAGERVVVTGPIDRATGKNVLWAWSAGSGVANKILEGHKAPVTGASWSKSGKTIVTCNTDGVVILWDSTTFQESSRLKVDTKLEAVAISDDGKWIVAAGTVAKLGPPATYREQVYLWQTATAKPQRIHDAEVGETFHGQVGVAFHPESKSLAVTFCDENRFKKPGKVKGEVRIWEQTPVQK